MYLYSVFYIEGTVDTRRFNWLVFGFVVSIGILVFSGNFLTLIIGWDGLGLISFCLVIFYSNYSSLESGLVTVFRNRVGDIFFLRVFILLFMGYNGLSDTISTIKILIFVFLFLGAITKRAQFPFSAWLPAAISAPTPVSSLVHSSTLVTAGVYVLLRFNYLFFYFNISFFKIFFLITILLAGVCACLETDFKKIVAISTLSQLGMILFILSVGVWLLTFIHIIIHAFFKSLLFMRTGSLIHNFRGGQDSRIFRNDSFSFGTFLCFFVSAACLMGFPFFMGFYSKDLIIIRNSLGLGATLYFIFLLGCFLTVSYRIRLLKNSFIGFFKAMPHMRFSDLKIFITSIFFLFIKRWILGRIFFPLFFFDATVSFLGLDLIVGLILILIRLLIYETINRSYPQQFYVLTIGFLRWIRASGSSRSTPINKIFRWDTSWIELRGGQGIYEFLIKINIFDFYKFLTIGFSFSFLTLIYLF